jgi:drug/metabolite transporter (DMT)-like permease
MPPVPAHNAVLYGIYCKLLAIVCFTSMDAVVKHLGASYETPQLLLFRSLVGLLPVWWLMAHERVGLRSLVTHQPALQVARVTLGFAVMFGFFWLFPRMPLAELYAISFCAPLFVTALSVPFLKERVGWRRWAAVAVGFVGVLIVLNPGAAAFQPLALLVVGATFLYSVNTIIVRKLSRTDSDQATAFYFALACGLVAAVWAPFVWKTPTMIDFAAMCAVGLLGGVGQLLFNRAYRLAPASTIVPFDYVSIVLALLFGWLFWSEAPPVTMWIGLPIIVASGLYILHRERVRSLQARRAPADSEKT